MSVLPPIATASEFPHKVMSALPTKADMCTALAHVRFRPKADITLFDHLIRTSMKGSGDIDFQCRCGLEVNHQFKSSGLHDWKFSGGSTLKNFPGINACLPIGIWNVGTVAHQTARYSKFPKRVDSWKRKASGSRNNNRSSLANEEGIGAYNERIRPTFGDPIKCSFDLGRRAGIKHCKLEAKRLRASLNRSDFGNCVRTDRVDQHRDH